MHAAHLPIQVKEQEPNCSCGEHLQIVIGAISQLLIPYEAQTKKILIERNFHSSLCNSVNSRRNTFISEVVFCSSLLGFVFVVAVVVFWFLFFLRQGFSV